MQRGKSVRIKILERIGPAVQFFRMVYLKIRGYNNISRRAVIERNVVLDRVFPEAINIDEYSLVAGNAILLCHEHVYRDPIDSKLPLRKPIFIGKRCFIGFSAMILPGVTVGDDCIIGAGAVVTRDVPPGSVAVGNPARIIKSGLQMSNRAVVLSVAGFNV